MALLSRVENMPFLCNDMEPVGGGRGPEEVDDEPGDWRPPLDEGAGVRL